ALLGEAIALDTTFAMAHRKLAVVLNNTGGAPSRIAEAATQAFRHRDRLTPLERDLAEAFYYYQAEFDRAKVESAYRSALELDPENYVALNNLALALNTQRKFAQADSLTLRGIGRGVAGNNGLHHGPAQPRGGQARRGGAPQPREPRVCRASRPAGHVCRRHGVARYDQPARSQCTRDRAAPGGRGAAPAPPG